MKFIAKKSHYSWKRKRWIIKSTILFNGCPNHLCQMMNIVRPQTSAKTKDLIEEKVISIG